MITGRTLKWCRLRENVALLAGGCAVREPPPGRWRASPDFPMSKHHISHTRWQGCAASGVKKIRVHDLRHSHVSLLINMELHRPSPSPDCAWGTGRPTSPTSATPTCSPNVQDDMANRLEEERGGSDALSRQPPPSPEPSREDVPLLAQGDTTSGFSRGRPGILQREYIMAKIEDKEFTIVPDVRTFKDASRRDARRHRRA